MSLTQPNRRGHALIAACTDHEPELIPSDSDEFAASAADDGVAALRRGSSLPPQAVLTSAAESSRAFLMGSSNAFLLLNAVDHEL